MQLVLVQPALSFDARVDNFALLHQLLEPHAAALAPDDIVLLPEHVDLRHSAEAYEASVQALSRALGCHVVAGSHHEDRDGGRINAGIACDRHGRIVGRYEKLRPYADERSRVQAGGALGELTIGRCRLLVLICADFWFSDVFYRTTELPDLILVPAHSVSRKPTPDYSRELWRHLAVTRAYEFGVYVGVSDWPNAPSPHGLPPSGVGGFADPTTPDPGALFTPITGALRVYDVDLDALDRFRQDRNVRGFFWRKELTPRS
jgi:predicted amidohydrolase